MENEFAKVVFWLFLLVAIVLHAVVSLVIKKSELAYRRKRYEETRKEKEKCFKYFVFVYHQTSIHPLLSDTETSWFPQVGETIILEEVDDEIMCRGQVTHIDKTNIHAGGKSGAVWVKIDENMYDFLILENPNWRRVTNVVVPTE